MKLLLYIQRNFRKVTTDIPSNKGKGFQTYCSLFPNKNCNFYNFISLSVFVKYAGSYYGDCSFVKFHIQNSIQKYDNNIVIIFY